MDEVREGPQIPAPSTDSNYLYEKDVIPQSNS